MAESNRYKIAREWELVWENPDPTASFAAQTLSIDQTNRSWFMIEARLSNSTNHGKYYEVPVYSAESGSEIQSSVVINMFGALCDDADNTSTGTPYLYTRIFTATENGIQVETSYRKTTNATTASTSGDTWIIPVRIWAR